MDARHHLAALLIARGLTFTEVAKRVSVSERTIRRWRTRPEFSLLIHEYNCLFQKIAESQEIDEVLFLQRTVSDSLRDQPKRRDGIAAAVVLLKLKGKLPEDKLRITGEITFYELVKELRHASQGQG